MKVILIICSTIVSVTLLGCGDDGGGRTSEKKDLPTTANDYDPQTGLTGDSVDDLKGEGK